MANLEVFNLTDVQLSRTTAARYRYDGSIAAPKNSKQISKVDFTPPPQYTAVVSRPPALISLSLLSVSPLSPISSFARLQVSPQSSAPSLSVMVTVLRGRGRGGATERSKLQTAALGRGIEEEERERDEVMGRGVEERRVKNRKEDRKGEERSGDKKRGKEERKEKRQERKRERRGEWRREGRRRLQEGSREEEETVDTKRRKRKSDVKLIGCSLMGAGLRERR